MLVSLKTLCATIVLATTAGGCAPGASASARQEPAAQDLAPQGWGAAGPRRPGMEFQASAACERGGRADDRDVEAPSETADIRIRSPQEGAVLSGTVDVALAIAPGRPLREVAFGIDQDPRPIKRAYADWLLRTMEFPNGAHTLMLRVVDREGRVHTDSIRVTFDNPPHQLLDHRFDQSSYDEGEEVVLTLRHPSAGLEVWADFSCLDPTPRAQRVLARDLGDKSYEVHYELSPILPRPNGEYPVIVTARDPSGALAVNRLSVRLQRPRTGRP